MVPALTEVFPHARYVWLIRNGLDVVASTYGRQWYTGHSANHSRYEKCPPLEKAWIDGRIMGNLCGDVPEKKWREMNPFAKCCWYWAYVNRIIEQDLNACVSPGRYRVFRIEEIDNFLRELTDWLGFQSVSELKVGHHNRAHYELHHWTDWKNEEVETFIYWCGPMMDRLYPNWRKEYSDLFDRVYSYGNRAFLEVEPPEGFCMTSKFQKTAEIADSQIKIFFTPQKPSKPKVSVYITSYNQKNFLVDAIESVLNQTFKPDQIIIADDCSTDGSQKIIEKYVRRYPEVIEAIYHDKNLGVVQTRIDALKRVKGDYITYLDGDDRFLPTKIEKEFSLLSMSKDALIAYSNNYYVDAAGNRIGVWVEGQLPPEGRVFCQTFGREFPKKSLFRMELINFQALKSVGFHDPQLSLYEDFDLRIRLSKHFPVAYYNEPLSEIRMHGIGLSSSKVNMHLASLDYLYRKNLPLLMDLTERERNKLKLSFNDWIEKNSLSSNVATLVPKPVRPKRKKASNRPMRSKSKVGRRGDGLIFIISQPRAGSTLLQRILHGHPEIHTTAEPWVMLHPLYALKSQGISTDYDSSLASVALQDFLCSFPDGPEAYIEAIREMAGSLYNKVLEHSGKKYFVDKTPRYYHVIPELYRIFPEAKFVFLLRHPLAVLSSILNTWFLNDTKNLTAPIYKDLLEAPIRLLEGLRLLKEKAITVDYERLVRHPVPVVHRLCERIGVNFFPKMVEYGRIAEPKGRFGDPVGIFKHDQPVDCYIDKWIRNLNTSELQRFAKSYLVTIGRELLDHLGYAYTDSLNKLGWKYSQSQSKSQIIEDFIKEGEKRYAEGKIDDALEIFNNALKHNDCDARIHNNLGIIAHASGKIEEALKSYRNAIRLEPQNITYQKNLADFLFFAKGDVEGALRIYHRVLQEHPRDIETMVNIGRICEILDKNDDAKDFYLQVLNYDPLNAEAMHHFELVCAKEGHNKLRPRNDKEGILTGHLKEGKKLVSAIVSTHNAERFMRGCLEDLVNQTIAEYIEIIVVDSGSEENEKVIVEEYMDRFDNIKYIRTESRENVYAAWNRGIQASTGKYITNANTDDRHRMDAFEIMVRTLEEQPDVSLVYANLIITETENETFDRCTPAGTFIWLDWSRDDLLNRGCFMGPQPLWRRDVHDEYGFFDDTLVTSGDYEFWLRISQTRSFKKIPEFLGLYLRTPNSIEHSNRDRQRIENEEILNIYKRAAKNKKIIRRITTNTDDILITKNKTRMSLEVDSPSFGGNENVSILIIDYRKNRTFKRCLENISKNTNEDHEIIIINKNLPKAINDTINKLFRNDIPVRTIPILKESGISTAINEGLRIASGKFVVLLSSEVIVFEGWLESMMNCFTKEKYLGVVGPMTNCSANDKQTILQRTGIADDIHEFAAAFYRDNQYRRTRIEWVDGFCMLFRKRLIDKIGYFDESLNDDTSAYKDLCLRAEIAGYDNFISGDVFVYNQRRHHQSNNLDQFNDKWRSIDNKSLEGKVYRALLHTRFGSLKYEQGRIDESIDEFLKAIGCSPENEIVYFWFAEMLIDAKRYGDALEVLQEMPSGDREREKLKLMAYCYEGLNRIEDAKRLIEERLSDKPDSPWILNLKGLISYKEENTDHAKEYFEKAIALDPGFGEPHSNLGLIKLGENREKGLQLLIKAFNLSPWVSDMISNIYDALIALQEYQKGEQIFWEACAFNPDNKNLRYKLIDFMLRQDKLKEAMEQIELAIVRFGPEEGLIKAALKVREQLGANEMDYARDGIATVSLCMIVKDEEKFIARCLDSVKPVVDEMIIIDTGSKDQTKDIAKVFGAQLFDLEWNDDFAAARNYSIFKAKGNWILIMDADEIISPKDFKQFKKFTAKKPKRLTAYSMVTRNYCHKANTVGWIPNDGKYSQEEAGIGWLPSEKVRLFSNNHGIKFEGAVHEMVDPILKRMGIEIKKSNIPVHHYGRLNTDKLDQKGHIYYEIGRKKLEKDGGDIGAIRELAIQANILEKNTEAITLWEKFISMKPNDGAIAEAYVNMGTAYIRMKEFEKALVSAQKAVTLNPEMKEAQYNMGMAELYSGDVNAAVATLTRLSNSHPDFPPAQFMLASAEYCRNEDTDKNGHMKKLKQSAFGPMLTYSIAELAEGLISVGQYRLGYNLLQNTIEEGITSKEIMNLYATCIDKIEKFKDSRDNDASAIKDHSLSVV